MATWLDKIWYTRHLIRWMLWPLSLVYQLICSARRRYLQAFFQYQCNVPVIVVGNISVGGVGKTPLVIALAEQLSARGLRVGIVSRGYGAAVRQFPYDVQPHDTATWVGDEPLLLAKKTGCPVIIAPNRVKAIRYLLAHYQSQIIISDDGLQHYAMGRAIEIAVVDGVRGLGNGLCLPAGPLRERAGRLKQVDFMVVNSAIKLNNPVIPSQAGTSPSTCAGVSAAMDPRLRGDDKMVVKAAYYMHLVPGPVTQLMNGHSMPLERLKLPVAAVAGIGHPQRFFATLQSLGLSFTAYPFADHYAFKQQDLCFTEKTIVMTEKDAVKCLPFATEAMYYLPVNASVCDTFWTALWSHQQLQGYV